VREQSTVARPLSAAQQDTREGGAQDNTPAPKTATIARKAGRITSNLLPHVGAAGYGT